MSGQRAARGPAGRASMAQGDRKTAPQAPGSRRDAGQESRSVIDAAGFDLRPDPLRADTAAALVSALREYRIWAGRPSYRKLAQRAGGTPAASTICTMLNSSNLPEFDCMLAFLTACGAAEEDRRRFATAWRRLSFTHGGEAGKQQIPAPRGPAEGLPDHQD